MSAQAAELADRFERANNDLIALIERLTGAQWAAPSEDDGRPVGVLAHHVATDHPILASFVEAVATGQPLPPLTMEMLDQYNAQHAAEHRGCTREETIDLLRREGAAAAGLVRRLTDEQLDRTAVIPWEGEAPVSARQLIERKLIGHIGEHLGGIRAAS
jgi:hypothetical protein